MSCPPGVLLYALDVDALKTSSLGIFHYTRNLLHAMAKRPKPPFRLLVLTNREAADSLLPANAPPWMEAVILEGSYSSGWKRLWADHVLSLVHARRHGTRVIFFPKGWIPFLPCPAHRLVTTMHDRMHQHYRTHYPRYHSAWRLGYWGVLFRRSLRRADLILTVSAFSASRLKEAASDREKSIRIVHEGPGIPCPGTVPDTPKGSILVIGSMLPHKRTRESVERLADFLSREPDPPPVHITGLTRWPESWGDEPNGTVHYRGRLTDKQLQQEFLQSKVLVFLSDMEGFGMPLLEALGHGTAICYRAQHAAAEIFHGVPGGWDGKNQEGFERALREALAMSPKASIREFKRIHALANWRRSAAEHHDAFAELLHVELSIQRYRNSPPPPPPCPMNYQTQRPLTILQVFNHYLKLGGEATSVERIASHLHAAGHRVVRFHRFSEEWCQRGAPPKIIQPLLMYRNPGVLEELVELHKEVKADIWLLHNVQPVISLEIYRQATRLGVPIVQWLHNYRPISPSGTLFANGTSLRPEDKALVWKEIATGSWRNSRIQTALSAAGYSRCFRRGDFESVKAWVGVSEHMRNLFAASGKLPEDRLHSLHHAWDMHPQPRQVKDDGYFLFLGRVLTSKGIGFLVRLFARPELSDCRLVIAGDGEDRVEWERASTANITWTGWVDGQRKAELLSRCTVVLFPSLWEEPLSTIAYEAYEHLKPIISSDAGGMPEIIEPGRTGMVVPAGDFQAWHAVVLDLHRHPEKAEQMGVLAREWLSEYVTPAAWNRAFDQIAATVMFPKGSFDD